MKFSDFKMPAVKRIHYDAAFKRKVIMFAEQKGNRAAERDFGISECNVRRWRSGKKAIFNCRSTSKAFTGPKRGRYPAVDDAVARFVVERRASALPVTRQILQLKALEEAKNQGIGNFKASFGWCRRFMIRNGFSLRRRTTICQKLPADFDQKLVSFQRYIMQLRKKNQYSLGQIGNADETPIYFDMPVNYTVAKKGSKQVSIKTAGYEKQRITAMLCATADGKKLPPYLIFKRKTVPKNEVFPKDVIIRAQPKGWMTEELMKDWIDVVWNKRPGAMLQPKSLLVLDAFKGHTTDPVKNALKKKKSDIGIIPGGMTSQLQPLDVCLNKPVKDYIKQEYNKWLSNDDLPLTATGKVKRASASTIAQWVSIAWKRIPEEMVRKSFKKCCISNNLDGSEDDILYEDHVLQNDEVMSSSDEDTDSGEDSDSD